MSQASNNFQDLGLPDTLLQSISDLGYETASPIQAQAIPSLLKGRDVLGQAQTGTGKTAAFALPILARVDTKSTATQVLVLAPTRELAIQVAEAFESYAKHMPQVRVLSIYGGQSYTNQLRQLKRGTQIVVGTPGRVMDHMRRGSLKLNDLKTLVLDEADEMLRMGFIDDVNRILEVEKYDGVIIFVRTKVSTEELSSKLRARGFSATGLNGDVPQSTREKTVDRLKKGDIDILVATDVVARGLDVERISHVINFDIPYDTEAYVHRIGRTGRAGRSGDAILFVAPREKRMLRAIEKVSGKSIEQMDIPSAAQINDIRIEQFNQQIMETIESGELSFYQNLVEKLITDKKVDPLIAASALAKLAQGGRSLLLDTKVDDHKSIAKDRRENSKASAAIKEGPIPPLSKFPDVDLKRYKIQVGRVDQVKPGQIVAAIANAADLSSDYIGHIEIYDKLTTVDLPDGMPKTLLRTLQKTRVARRPMKMVEVKESFPQGEQGRKPRQPQKRKVEKRPER